MASPGLVARRPDLDVVEIGRMPSLLLNVIDAQAARARVRAATSIELPLEPNTTVDGPPRVLWLSPHEWLIATEDRAIAEQLGAVLADIVHLITDLTASRFGVALSGAAARDLLRRGCGIDLHPTVFAPGRCGRCLFAGVPALIHLDAASGRFELSVDRTYSDYLRRWLAMAAERLECS